MSDEVFSTTLAYTKSPKVTKRTTFQDELLKAVTARSARQRSSEYSDDLDSDEIVSLGDFSDTSADENSVKRKMNDFHISDDDENNFPRLSFLKTKKSNNDIIKDEPVCLVRNDEEVVPDGCEDAAVNSSSEPQNKNQEIEKEKMEVEPKPRILQVKSVSSDNLLGSDQNEEFTENCDSLKSKENEENSLLIDLAPAVLEKPKQSLVSADALEGEKEKAELMVDGLTVDSLLFKSQSVLISTSATESTKKAVEDRNISSKSSTNSRASSASGRLMTSTFLKKPGSVKKTPLAATSSEYLGTLKVLDQKTSQKQSMKPDKADDIRAAVYQIIDVFKETKYTTEVYENITAKNVSKSDWLEKKNVYLHEIHRIKRIESENFRIQNEQKRVAKREEALASFEAWKAVKEKEAKKRAAKKRLEEKNKKKTEEENAGRKREALQAFEKWKEKKTEYLKEKSKKEKEYERARKQKEEETVAEKKKDNLTAVEKWNEKKAAFFKQKEKEKINEKKKEELKTVEKKDKDKQALDEYERWLEKKERQERIERKRKKRHSFLPNEAPPPWSPPSRTVFSKVF